MQNANESRRSVRLVLQRSISFGDYYVAHVTISDRRTRLADEWAVQGRHHLQHRTRGSGRKVLDDLTTNVSTSQNQFPCQRSHRSTRRWRHMTCVLSLTEAFDGLFFWSHHRRKTHMEIEYPSIPFARPLSTTSY